MIRSGKNSSANGRLSCVIQLEAAVLHGAVGDEVEPEVIEARDEGVGDATRVATEPAYQGRVLVVPVAHGQVVVLHSVSTIIYKANERKS